MQISNLNPRATLRSLALVLLIGCLGTAPVLASQVTVGFRDLDLNTIEGARTLYGRISAAAKKVCGYQGTALTDRAIWQGCYRDAVSGAVARVNSPLLTAVHTGRPAGPAVAMLTH